jgi:hypothetical protein
LGGQASFEKPRTVESKMLVEDRIGGWRLRFLSPGESRYLKPERSKNVENFSRIGIKPIGDSQEPLPLEERFRPSETDIFAKTRLIVAALRAAATISLKTLKTFLERE